VVGVLIGRDVGGAAPVVVPVATGRGRAAILLRVRSRLFPWGGGIEPIGGGGADKTDMGHGRALGQAPMPAAQASGPAELGVRRFGGKRRLPPHPEGSSSSRALGAAMNWDRPGRVDWPLFVGWHGGRRGWVDPWLCDLPQAG